MTDIILKLNVLVYDIGQAFTNWKREVWSKDGDERLCCGARGTYGEVDCGCGGVSQRDYWESIAKRN